MRFSRFNLVGLLGAILQLVLINLLTKRLRLPIFAATLIAVEIAVLHNFLWHQRFTWPDRKTAGFWQSGKRLMRFHAANGLISLCGNSVAMHWLVERLQFPVLPSTLAAIAVCAVMNFLLADRWVYGPARYRI